MKLPLGGLIYEVLRAKGDNSALSDEQGELRSLARGEEMQLDPRDLGPEIGREVVDDGVGEEAPRGWVV